MIYRMYLSHDYRSLLRPGPDYIAIDPTAVRPGFQSPLLSSASRLTTRPILETDILTFDPAFVATSPSLPTGAARAQFTRVLKDTSSITRSLSRWPFRRFGDRASVSVRRASPSGVGRSAPGPESRTRDPPLGGVVPTRATAWEWGPESGPNS